MLAELVVHVLICGAMMKGECVCNGWNVQGNVLKMHVKACELNGCEWKCGCNDEVNACGMDAKGIRLGNDGVFLW